MSANRGFGVGGNPLYLQMHKGIVRDIKREGNVAKKTVYRQIIVVFFLAKIVFLADTGKKWG